MEALLSAYSLEEILLFLVLLFGAIKEGSAAFEWIREKYNIKFNKDYQKIDNQKQLEEHYNHCVSQHLESINRIKKLEERIESSLLLIEKRLDDMKDKIILLTESDRDDIKSWLVEKYTYYKENPTVAISAHTMDTIEKRYNHYKREGGNSYIENTIMPGLREMAKEERKNV